MGVPRFIEIVLAEEGSLHLEVYANNTLFLTRDYKSLLALLNALLSLPAKDTYLFQIVDLTWVEHAIDALDSIIPTIGNRPRSLPEKFMMYQQVHGRRDLFEFAFKVHVRKDFILSDLWDHVLSLGEEFKADSYAEISEMYNKYGVSVPIKDYYGFDTYRDLGNWVLQKVIDQNSIIRKCAWCNRYFVPSRPSTQTCCSQACKQAHKVLTDYFGELELAKEANAIKSIFDRKSKSDKSYKYLYPKFGPSFDAFSLFLRANISTKDPFTKKEFIRLRQAFFTENESRRQSFSSAHASYTSGKLTQDFYIGHRDDYLAWMKNVHLQLKSFSSSKKHFTVLERSQDFEYIDKCTSGADNMTIEEFCSVPRTAKEICIFLGHNSPNHVKTKVLAPLLESGLLTIINPQRPQSKPALFQANPKT